MGKTILLIEDNKEYSNLISKGLREENYDVISVDDGLNGIKRFKENEVDLIIVEFLLPNLNGLDILMKIREISNVPVIMITDANSYKIQEKFFSLGGNDFIAKPFYIELLVKRIKAIINLEILGCIKDNIWQYKDTKIDFSKYTVIKNGIYKNVGAKPLEVLKYLVDNKGRVISRNQIIDSIWGFDIALNYKSIDVHISNIRKSLELDCIKTIRGIGYKLEC